MSNGAYMGLHIQMDQPNQLADPAYQHRHQQHQYQKSFFLSASKPWHLRTLFYNKCGTGYGIHQTTACHMELLAPTSGLHPVCTSGWWCKLQPKPPIFGQFGDHHQPPTKASHGPLAMWDYHWLVVDLPLCKKYDVVSWDDDIPNWMEKQNMFETTNQITFELTQNQTLLSTDRISWAKSLPAAIWWWPNQGRANVAPRNIQLFPLMLRSCHTSRNGTLCVNWTLFSLIIWRECLVNRNCKKMTLWTHQTHHIEVATKTYQLHH